MQRTTGLSSKFGTNCWVKIREKHNSFVSENEHKFEALHAVSWIKSYSEELSACPETFYYILVHVCLKSWKSQISFDVFLRVWLSSSYVGLRKAVVSMKSWSFLVFSFESCQFPLCFTWWNQTMFLWYTLNFLQGQSMYRQHVLQNRLSTTQLDTVD